MLDGQLGETTSCRLWRYTSPWSTVARVKKSLPWINREILSAIRKRDISFRIAKSSGRSSDRAKCNRKRNHVVDVIRE